MSSTRKAPLLRPTATDTPSGEMSTDLFDDKKKEGSQKRHFRDNTYPDRSDEQK